mgnify:CR=1 FL=1
MKQEIDGKKSYTGWIIVTIIVTIIIIALIIYFSTMRNKYTLTFNGESVIEVLEGKIYNDPGCKAYKNGELLNVSPEIINNVNVNIPGEYETKCLYHNVSLTRKVIVKEDPSLHMDLE